MFLYPKSCGYIKTCYWILLDSWIDGRDVNGDPVIQMGGCMNEGMGDEGMDGGMGGGMEGWGNGWMVRWMGDGWMWGDEGWGMDG